MLRVKEGQQKTHTKKELYPSCQPSRCPSYLGHLELEIKELEPSRKQIFARSRSGVFFYGKGRFLGKVLNKLEV